jgi:hypothetical protein
MRAVGVQVGKQRKLATPFRKSEPMLEGRGLGGVGREAAAEGGG